MTKSVKLRLDQTVSSYALNCTSWKKAVLSKNPNVRTERGFKVWEKEANTKRNM